MAEPDLIGIVVNDMAAALRFYRMLGLDIPADADSEPHVEYTTRGGFRVAWDTLELIQSLNDDWPEPSGHRTVLAFKCENPTDVDVLYKKVMQEGYQSHKEPWDAFWGQRYAVVIDPDGNLVDLFANFQD
ncbi:MAG: VOC family protein [Anaerolineales bacterium]|nr:VOC family protein [Chloroflexota bacterium]MBL6981704.1 VOC family protein [Anaerolineales bacterium]